VSEESDNLAYASKVLMGDAPARLQFEIAKSSAEGAVAYGLRRLAPWMIARIQAEYEFVSIRNQQNERQATRSHCPEATIPEFMYHCYEAVFGEGCWRDKDFMKDTLEKFPGLRCKVKYGTKGQEYVNGKGH
jgi:hypothetical protein